MSGRIDINKRYIRSLEQVSQELEGEQSYELDEFMTEVLKMGDEIAPWQILANTSFLFGGSVVRVVQPPDPGKSSVQCPCRRLDLASSARMRRTMCSAVRFAVATRLRDQSGKASAGTVVVERTCAVHSAGLIDYHMTFL